LVFNIILGIVFIKKGIEVVDCIDIHTPYSIVEGDGYTNMVVGTLCSDSIFIKNELLSDF